MNTQNKLTPVENNKNKWVYKDCIIQEASHPLQAGNLTKKYEVFTNTEDEYFLGRYKTLKGAIRKIDKYKT